MRACVRCGGVRYLRFDLELICHEHVIGGCLADRLSSAKPCAMPIQSVSKSGRAVVVMVVAVRVCSCVQRGGCVEACGGML